MSAVRSRVIALTRATSKLHGQTIPTKLCSIFLHFKCGQRYRRLRRRDGGKEGTYDRLIKESAWFGVSWAHWGDHSPGTTSRASMGSSYSMKPNPFISLISWILPEASLKCSWISSLVTAVRGRLVSRYTEEDLRSSRYQDNESISGTLRSPPVFRSDARLSSVVDLSRQVSSPREDITKF